jgi:hypothetical protein
MQNSTRRCIALSLKVYDTFVGVYICTAEQQLKLLAAQGFSRNQKEQTKPSI